MELSFELEGFCERCGTKLQAVTRVSLITGKAVIMDDGRAVMFFEPCQKCLDKIADDDSNYIRGYNDGVESCEN